MIYTMCEDCAMETVFYYKRNWAPRPDIDALGHIAYADVSETTTLYECALCGVIAIDYPTLFERI